MTQACSTTGELAHPEPIVEHSGTGAADDKASVFISYSRSDGGFVRKLLEQLKRSGREVWVDLEDIPPTARWLAEVKAGIEATEAFVFVISPDSIASEVCQTEVAHAAGLNKRIVPLVRGDVDERLVPEPLAQRNWIFFRDDGEFDSGLRALNEALDTDLDWLHSHAELLRRALAWERGGRRASALLRGAELEEAEAWLGSGAGGGQQPTAAHREFILASRRSAGHRQRSFLAAVSVALVVAIGLAILALTQRSAAIENQKRAESQQLAAVADSQVRVDPERSLLLALGALDISETDAGWESLKRALGASRLRETFPGRDDAEFSPDGRTVTTVANEGNAYIWDVKGEELVAVSKRSTPFSVSDPVVYSPDGSLVAIGENRHSRVLDPRSGEELARLPGAVGMAFTADSSLLAMGAIRSGVIRIWEPRSGKRLRTLRGHPARAQYLAWAPGKRLASASIDGTARIWSVEGSNGKLRGSGRSLVLRGHARRLRDVAYSPDGRVIATASDDGSARLWEASSGAELAVLRSGRHGKVENVDFSPDGSHLVLPHGDGVVQIWSSDGRLVRTLRGHRGEVRSAKFSPDGRLIASGGYDRTARIWEAESGRTVAVLRGHQDAVKDVEFSPDGSLLVTTGLEGTARLWSLRSAEDAVDLPVRGDAELTALAAAPAGRLIATGDAHGGLRLWNAVTGASVATLAGGHSAIRSLVFAADGKTLVAAGDSSRARVYSLSGDGSTTVLRGGHGPIAAVGVDDAGDLVLTAGGDGTVRLWGPDGALERVLGEGGPVRTAALDPAGERVIAGGDDGIARIWDVRSGRLERAVSAHDGAIRRSAFSSDGELALTAGNDGTVVVWDAESGDRVAALEEHSGAINDARFSPDGESVVTASDDGTARIWDARSGAQLQLLRGLGERVAAASFNRDGKLVLTAGFDGSARVWEAHSGKQLATLEGPGNFVEDAEFTPGGAVAIGAEDSKNARLYSCELCLTPAALRELAENRATRELTAAERAEFLNEGP